MIDDFQLFTMLADGSDLRPLIAGAHEGPRWSPDGSMISVTSFEGGNFLRILHPDGSLVRALALPDATIGLGCAVWSPDATHLACEGWDDAHPDRIGLYTVLASDGSALTRLTSPTDGMHDIPGDYSPDGTQIAYVHVTSDQRETGQLWMVNADGSNAHLVSDLQIGWGVRWSPDGRWIAGDSNHSLVIFDGADLSAAPRVIKLPGPGLGLPAFGASWSPDGSRLAFSVLARGSQPDIATIAIDGTDLWILTNDPAKEEFADWGLPQ